MSDAPPEEPIRPHEPVDDMVTEDDRDRDTDRDTDREPRTEPEPGPATPTEPPPR